MIELDLQMFSEGGDGAAAGTEAPGADFQVDAALDQYRQTRFKGRKAQKAAAPEQSTSPVQEPKAEPPQAEEQPTDRKQAFRDLIKGDYKAEAGEWVEELIKERFKNQRDVQGELKAAQEQQEKLNPLLEALYQKHNVAQGDLDSLVKQITNDDSLYEDEALQRGIPVDTLKEMKEIQREAEALKAQQAQQAERQFYERHVQGLVQQGEELKQMYPNFDLQAELQNSEFFRLTSPNVGIDVKTAFEVVHRQELETMRAEAITKKVSEDMTRAYLSGSKRPAENGTTGGSTAISLSDDPSQWDKKTLQRIINDAKGGKKIRL